MQESVTTPRNVFNKSQRYMHYLESIPTKANPEVIEEQMKLYYKSLRHPIFDPTMLAPNSILKTVVLGERNTSRKWPGTNKYSRGNSKNVKGKENENKWKQNSEKNRL